MSDHYDVIIIGTGAGGGTLARALASTGKRILLLERGGYLPRERENMSSRAVFLEGRYKANEAWIDKDGNAFHPVRREGKVEDYAADIVVVSCGAVNSAALLLRSASDKHPTGLANRSGVVGRHYMAHNNSAFVCVTTKRNPTIFEKTLALNDFYFGAPDSELPLGHIQMLGKSDGMMLKGDAPPLVPLFVLEGMAQHAFDFWLTSEDLPDPNNRVTLDGEGRIHLAYTPNNLEAHERLVKKLKELCGKLLPWGLKLSKRIPIEGTAHQCGTVRFGTDPRTSALDPNCKAHDVDNLYVVDASFFVSSTAVNPGLTIMANALRVADHLHSRL